MRSEVAKPLSFDFRQLEIFCQVVEARSFTRAAESLRLSQASVSERIGGLELSVGARLLDRLGREVRPTAIGRRFHERARELLQRRREVEDELAGLLGIESGTVLFGASTIPGEYILPGLLARFRSEHPGVRMDLRIGDTAVITAGVAAGEFEFGVVGSRSAQGDLDFTPVGRDELVLVVRADHPWARRRKVRLRELATQPFLLREGGSGTRRVLEDAIKRASEAELPKVADLGSTGAIKTGILTGLGVSILSSRAVETERRAGLLATARIEDLELERPFWLLRDPRRSLSPAGERLFAFILAEFD